MCDGGCGGWQIRRAAFPRSTSSVQHFRSASAELGEYRERRETSSAEVGGDTNIDITRSGVDIINGTFSTKAVHSSRGGLSADPLPRVSVFDRVLDVETRPSYKNPASIFPVQELSGLGRRQSSEREEILVNATHATSYNHLYITTRHAYETPLTVLHFSSILYIYTFNIVIYLVKNKEY